MRLMIIIITTLIMMVRCCLDPRDLGRLAWHFAHCTTLQGTGP